MSPSFQRCSRCSFVTCRRVCANPARFADRVEFALVDDAGKLLPDDAPATVANLTLDWIQRPTEPNPLSSCSLPPKQTARVRFQCLGAEQR
jgi:hypothetical protein